MSKTVTSKLTQGNSAEERITWSAATARRIKEEATRGRVWIAGQSGTGKSFITSEVGGFDLDRIGFRYKNDPNGDWEIDLTRIPNDAKILCGCFNSPSYEEFYKLFKPTSVYVITCSTNTYARTYIRKAASKRNGLFWKQALGIELKGDTLHHDPARVGNPDALRETLAKVPNQLREAKIPFVFIVNDHDEDRGPAWDAGDSELEMYPDDLIGLGLLAIEGHSYARSLLRKRAPDPRYNPHGWIRIARFMLKGGLRLSPEIEKKVSASSNRWELLAGKFKIPPSRNPRNPAYRSNERSK
jgi:hypothetical protein